MSVHINANSMFTLQITLFSLYFLFFFLNKKIHDIRVEMCDINECYGVTVKETRMERSFTRTGRSEKL